MFPCVTPTVHEALDRYEAELGARGMNADDARFCD